MKTALFALLGLIFPPAAALRHDRKALFVALAGAQLVLAATFFFVFVGPAILGHGALWLVACFFGLDEARSQAADDLARQRLPLVAKYT